jgi:O-antigen ligase
MLFKPEWHRWIYLAALALVAIGLPLSKAVMSIGEIALVANFLLEGGFQNKINRFKNQPTLWLFIAVFALHILGLAWSEDISWGLKDVNIKLPLLVFPVVIALSPKIKRTQFLWIAALFSASVIITSFFSTYKFLQIMNMPEADYRSISIFMSHIRYGLMVCMAFLILLNCAWNEEKKMWLRIVYVGFAIWLSIFVFLLQSMTGIIVWLVSSYVMLLYTLFQTKNKWIKRVGLSLLILTPVLATTYLITQVKAFYPSEETDFGKLDRFTAGGETYSHDTASLSIENGHYIHLYTAHNELRRAWNRRSQIIYPDGRDANGNFIYSTAIRYLTSKNLRKDSLGVNALTEEDIKAIENGIANVRFNSSNTIQNRVYNLIWEFDKLLYEPNPEGHSVTQRLEFWKTGWNIFMEHPIIGVGTGDLQMEYRTMYQKLETGLAKEFRLRAHNQFLTIGVALGIIGFLLFITSLFLPFFTLKNANSYLFIGFAIILYMSMLNEDTLETQAGATLYAFFNSLFLYALGSLSPKDARAEE